MIQRLALWFLMIPLLVGAGPLWPAVDRDEAIRGVLAAIPRAAAEAYLADRPYRPPIVGIPVQGGVFVTLMDERGPQPITRACWGSLHPEGTDLGEVIALTARKALTQDWRQPAVRTSELGHVRFVVALVGPLQAVPAGERLRPKTEGLYLTDGRRGAVLLPGEALTASWQEWACRQKAGIPARAPVYRYRFHTLTVEEPPR